MNIDTDWLEPFDLRDGYRDGLIYAVEDFGSIPDTAGIYFFGCLDGKADALGGRGNLIFKSTYQCP